MVLKHKHSLHWELNRISINLWFSRAICIPSTNKWRNLWIYRILKSITTDISAIKAKSVLSSSVNNCLFPPQNSSNIYKRKYYSSPLNNQSFQDQVLYLVQNLLSLRETLAFKQNISFSNKFWGRYKLLISQTPLV